MPKERKTRNFDFLKQTPPELPSREEVIQKTAELTGRSFETSEAPPSVVEETEVTPTPVKAKKTLEKKEKASKTQQKPRKQQKSSNSILPEKPIVMEKAKVGRRALADTRKPFTTTITVDNKRRLRELCAKHDIAMSDVINEILTAQFENRPPRFI